MNFAAKIYSIIKDQKVGGQLDVQLENARTTDSVYWSPRWPEGGGFNSYVCMEGDAYQDHAFESPEGKKFVVASINGIGEIRWVLSKRELADAKEAIEKYPDIMLRNWDVREYICALRHFGLLE